MLKFNQKNKLTETRRFLLVGLVFFVYSLGISVVIQTYIVPEILPQLNFGEGIVTLDATGFNQIAKAKAEEIGRNGWRAWELRPEAQSPAGVASIFYTLWTPKPYSLLPFNALVHALSGCLVLWLLRHFFSWKSAIFGSTLFVINPAAMQWVAQIHRDGVFILGNLIVLACLTQFWCGLKSGKVRTMTWGIILGVIGGALVWIARPYWVQVLAVILMLGLMIIILSSWMMRAVPSKKRCSVFFAITLAIFLLVFQGWLMKQEVAGLNSFVSIKSVEKTLGIKKNNEETPERNIKPGYIDLRSWEYTEWVPYVIESKLFQIYIARNGALNTGGNTVVDTDIILNSALAFVAYFPRALQLGFLSPLPELWQGEGSTQTMTIARKAIGIVTFIFYFFLMGSVLGIYLFRKNLLTWLILMFCFIGIIVFIYTYPNIGTFLRFRYGFYMLLIAFGAANIAELSFAKFRKHHN